MSPDEDEPTKPMSLDEPVPGLGSHQALPAPDPDAPVDRADVIGEGARSFAAWSGRFVITVIALGIVGWGLLQLSSAIIPVLLGLLIASVLYPIVSGLRRIGLPHSLGAALSLLTGIVVIGGLVSLIAPSVVAQWPQLADQTIRGIRQVQQWVAGPPMNLQDEQLNEYLQQFTNWLQGYSSDIVSIALSLGGSVGSGIVTLAMTLVIVFFMLKDGHKFVGFSRSIVGRRWGFHVSELFARLWVTLSGYIRTQAVVSFVDALFIGLGLWLLDVPLAFPIAVLTFMAGFIPIVGAFSAGAVAVLVALVTGGLVQALLVLALVVLVQQIEGNVLQPVLQARVMQLHPVIVILAVLLGGGWAGIIGAFLAVPVAAAGAVVLRYLGDMIDLRTGDRAAADINWVTADGRVVGGESEKSAMLFRALIRRRERVEPEAEAAEEVLGPEPLEPTTSAVLPRKPRPVFGNPFRRRG
ncbi:AI-2E family transporter [Tessaracoccus oleiagri]|uniref:Predicted PurR-regulated permease PerM n=1 Tax=Tessaracoccus oleiagri TaxID=686624 RepID=A0A1G9IHN8_9ACTN|nr:AI-2E family transporter [Tessaracoccus oleiagri]SDL24748.1 Predicted PurR-regulated permease PerM [Tessaracoccus oleiagri]